MSTETRVTVTHRCLHAGAYTVRGTRSEQSTHVARLRLLDCPQCRREAATAQAAADGDRLKLPVLAGTHGEVSEALRVRARHLRTVAAAVRASYIQQAIADGEGPLAADERARIEERATAAGERAALAILAPPLAHTEARWWIETRDLEVDELLARAASPSPRHGVDAVPRSAAGTTSDSRGTARWSP